MDEVKNVEAGDGKCGVGSCDAKVMMDDVKSVVGDRT